MAIRRDLDVRGCLHLDAQKPVIDIRDEVAKALREHPEVAEAWSVTGEADAIARVRTQDNADLERLIIELQSDGLVQRTRSQVVLSRLAHHGSEPAH